MIFIIQVMCLSMPKVVRFLGLVGKPHGSSLDFYTTIEMRCKLAALTIVLGEI